MSTTEAFSEFERNLDAARQMVQAGRSLENLKVNAFDISDMYRQAWVHAVSALDHWVHQEIYHRAVALFAGPGEKPDKLKRFPITVELFEKVHHKREPPDEVFREQLQATLGYQSYQHPDKIKEGFAHVTEIPLWREVATRLSDIEGAHLDVTEVKDRLARIVERRNKIAHEADRDTLSPTGRCPMLAGDAQRTIDWLHGVVTAMLDALEGATTGAAGRSYLLVLSNAEAVGWVLAGSRMAFVPGMRREAQRLAVGDTLYIVTTKECWGSWPGAATLVVGSAVVRSPVKDLSDSVHIGSREFTIGCDLSIRGLAPFRRGVDFGAVAPELGLIRNKEAWGAYLQRALIPLPDDDAEVVRGRLSGLLGDPADYATDYITWRRGRPSG